MLLLGCGNFNRVADFGRIDDMRRQCLLGQGPGLCPAETEVEINCGNDQNNCENSSSSSGELPVALPRVRDIERCFYDWRNFFRHDIGESLFQRLFLAVPSFDGRTRLGVVDEFAFEQRFLRRLELAVGIGVKDPVVFVVRSNHLMRLKLMGSPSSKAARRLMRARESRDITVPTGTPVTSAISR